MTPDQQAIQRLSDNQRVQAEEVRILQNVVRDQRELITHLTKQVEKLQQDDGYIGPERREIEHN